MVNLGKRSPSRNIVDRRPPGANKTPGRSSGMMIGLGFAGALAAGALGVTVTGLNTVMAALGIDRELTAPSFEAPRRAEIDDFSAVILGDTERIWTAEFQRYGATYHPPQLVFYEGQTTSGCGVIQADFGPVYCGYDRQILLDLSFFDSVAGDFGAEGDFPPAYVIAHEVAHHVQLLTGDMDIFYDRLDAGREPANQLQVRFELQADCLAGIWTQKADQAFGLLEQGDIEEGIAAASAFGDDAIQMMDRGVINEASFTHGSSQQRAKWFMSGYESGEMAACDTWTQAYDAL